MTPPEPQQTSAEDRTAAIDHILGLFEDRGSEMYGGEPVTQTQHALQSAQFAVSQGADSQLITAALLHDVGHLLTTLPEDCADDGIDDQHELIAAKWLSNLFGKRVSEPIRLHVAAKRYRCTTDSEYYDSLSDASKKSFVLQGGLMSEVEIKEFESSPYCQDAIRLRNWDDEAKDPNAKTLNLRELRSHLEFSMGQKDASSLPDTHSTSTD